MNVKELEGKIKVTTGRIENRRKQRNQGNITNRRTFETNQYRDKKKLFYLMNRFKILSWLNKIQELRENPLGITLPKRCKQCLYFDENFFDCKTCKKNLFIYQDLPQAYLISKHFNNDEIEFLRERIEKRKF